MKRFTILLLFIVTNVVFAESTITIGTVTIRQEAENIHIIQGDFKKTIECTGSALDYIYILDTPYVDYTGGDGVLEFKGSKGLRRWPENLSKAKSSFKPFAFFDNSRTCIGILAGYAGASGGSTQTFLFLDTASDKHQIIMTFNLHEPAWIPGKNHPVGYKKCNQLFVGSHANGLGYANRTEKIYSLVKGVFLRDKKLEKAGFKSAFAAIKFTVKDLSEYQKTELLEIDRESGRKVVDMVYYGTRLGRDEEVGKFLVNASAPLRKQLEELVVHVRSLK